MWGINKKYKHLNWFENFMSGSLTLGPITVYGENAMHWAVNIRIRKNYWCFRLPFRCFGEWWPLYFYISSDGTPNKATYKIGRV